MPNMLKMRMLPWRWLAYSYSPFSRIEHCFSRGFPAYVRAWNAWMNIVKRQDFDADDAYGSTAVILLSYKRPWNMQPILWSALKCRWAEKILVINNNPSINIHSYLSYKDPRIQVINEDKNYGAMRRYERALEVDADHYILIDDDIFVTPRRLSMLLYHLVEHSEVPHTMWGQLLNLKASPGERWKHGIRRECTVDIMNRVYACTKKHVHEYFRLLEELQKNTEEERIAMSMLDDVVISFAGSQKPQCHPIGVFVDCPTASSHTIAQWKQDRFHQKRIALYGELTHLKPLTDSFDCCSAQERKADA